MLLTLKHPSYPGSRCRRASTRQACTGSKHSMRQRQYKSDAYLTAHLRQTRRDSVCSAWSEESLGLCAMIEQAVHGRRHVTVYQSTPPMGADNNGCGARNVAQLNVLTLGPNCVWRQIKIFVWLPEKRDDWVRSYLAGERATNQPRPSQARVYFGDQLAQLSHAAVETKTAAWAGMFCRPRVVAPLLCCTVTQFWS